LGRCGLRKFPEKYLKKLIGKTDIEDALKRLDKLTNEEVRMVTAKVLEATHTVEHKVTVVIDGTQLSLINHSRNMFNSDVPRGKRDKGSHTTNGRRHGSSETLVTFFLR
jgi:hypothetical protein